MVGMISAKKIKFHVLTKVGMVHHINDAPIMMTAPSL